MNAALEHTSPSRRTRLALADVAAPVLLDVEARRHDGLTVARSLPFLGLGREVRDEDGRLAHIENIYVELEDDTPRLVMDLTYAQVAPDHTVPYITPSRLPPPPALPAAPRTREGTLLFHTPSVAPHEERVSTAPVQLYEDTDALKDGLASAGRGLFTAGRAFACLSIRALAAALRGIGRLTLKLWRASRHLGASYADAPVPTASVAE